MKNRNTIIQGLFAWTLSLITTVVIGQDFNQLQKIVENPRDVNNFFGAEVAIFGDYAMVGNPREGEDVSGANTLDFAGAVYVYEKTGTDQWTEIQKLVPSDRDSFDSFGGSVAMSANYALITANGKEKGSLFGVGAVYVFEKSSNGTWNEIQKIEASDGQNRDFFGRRVAMDGNKAIVSASGDQRPLSNAGLVYFFEQGSNGQWTEVSKIEASDAAEDDLFGLSLAISGDYAVVGAYMEDEDTTDANTLSEAGAAYIIERNSNGTWSEKQKIIASDREAEDLFGFSVSISGTFAVISSHFDGEDAGGTNTLSFAGSAHVFERSTSGVWNETQKIVASDRAQGDLFGWDIVIADDYLLISASGNDTDSSGENSFNDAGALYLFNLSNSGVWEEIQKITPQDRSQNDQFGDVFALSGNDLFVGAQGDEQDADGNGSTQNGGSAYFFKGSLLNVKGENFGSNFQLSPNPTSGSVFLDLGTLINSATLSVFNLLGEKVYTQPIIKNSSVTLNLESLSSGVYIVRVESEKAYQTMKLIKK